MTDEQPAEKKRKGILGFYIGLGAVVLLLVGFYFAWTPLRVLYWERQVLQKAPGYTRKLEESQDGRVVRVNILLGDPAGKLAGIGAEAVPAFERLLRAEDPGVRLAAVGGLNSARGRWCVPLLVGAVRDADSEVSVTATGMVADIMKNGLHKSSKLDLTRAVNLYFSLQRKDQARIAQEVLDWWKTEGRAKYGSGGD